MRLFIVVLLILWSLPGLARDALTISEWSVPWPDTRPRDPDVAADGSIWLVGQAGHYVARFNPEDESFSRFELPDGAGPHNLIVGPRGQLWIAGNRQGWIGRMDPETGELYKWSMPNDDAGDPHTLVFGDDNTLWFTVQRGNYVGRFTHDTRKIDLVPVQSKNARPYGIRVAPDTYPWIALLGTNRIATVHPDDLTLIEYIIPREEARPRRIDVTSDGKVWYVDYAGGYLGRFDPVTQTFTEWLAPAGKGSRPYAMAVDDQDRIWFAETGPNPNTLVGFDPKTEQWIGSIAVPSGAGTVRHMIFDPKTRSFWFGTDTNNLARLTLSAPEE